MVQSRFMQAAAAKSKGLMKATERVSFKCVKNNKPKNLLTIAKNESFSKREKNLEVQ